MEAPAAPPPHAAAAPSMQPPYMLQKASLYVGDLHREVTETELVEAFRALGPIASVRLCRDIVSGSSLRYAYVNFFSHSHAAKALACLNHTKLRGKPMRIMWSQRDPLPRKTGIANLFVKNLDVSINSSLLQGIFCKYGTILSCKVAEENGKSKGFGFVQFKSEESAMAALNALHNTMLEGKKLFVSKFVKQCGRMAAGEELKFTDLYVKNLDEDVTENILLCKFSEFGKVCNVAIMRDDDGKSRGFGFVNFESPEAAKKAVDALNGALLGSKNLFVGRAQKKAEREELLKREHKEMFSRRTENLKGSNLYVKNLVPSVDDRKLKELFSAYGQITSAKVMYQDNGKSKGFGFVCFSTPEEAKKALYTLNGAFFEGKSLYVAIAQRKEDRCKELQHYHSQYHLQSFYSPNWNVLPPELCPVQYNFNQYSLSNPFLCQPMTYQQFGTNFGARYPFVTHNFQQHFTHVPMKQTQQVKSRDWVPRQHSMTYYETSNVHTQDLNYGNQVGQKLGSRKRWNKRCGPAESSFRPGSASCGDIHWKIQTNSGGFSPPIC